MWRTPQSSVPRRRAWRRTVSPLSRKRVETDLACGRHGKLVAELDALTRAHPLRERLWAQRMIALYRAGRQAEALHAYQELRATLRDGLGLEPSNALRHLEGAILRQEPHLDWQPDDDGEPLLTEIGRVFDRTPFVGRAAERATLSSALAQSLRGSGSMVLIGGDPGIGKTRLAEEAGSEAARLGMSVLAGHSYEMAGASPYLPFVEILEMALAEAAAPRRSWPARWVTPRPKSPGSCPG